jgi:YHS domain-containing protein
MGVSSKTAAKTVKDPVCGMKVSPANAATSAEHAGRTWHFCNQSCLTKFQADPGRYDGSHQAPAEPVAPATKPATFRVFSQKHRLQNHTLMDGLDQPMSTGDDTTNMNLPTAQ